MTDDAFLDRYRQAKLKDAIYLIETHLDDLADTITKQAVIGRRDVNTNRRRKRLTGKAPVHEGAQEVADHLQNALSTAIRHAVEYRALPYPPECASMVGMCRWLRRNMITFAMTEGAPDWADDIELYGQKALQLIDLPPDDYVHIDYQRVKAANQQLVTVATVDVVARRLGDLGKGLNGRRIRTLVNRGLLKSNGEDAESGTKFYRLGDVLDAHHRHQRRQRAS